MVAEQPERFFVAEIVREKILLQYYQEVPYATAVRPFNPEPWYGPAAEIPASPLWHRGSPFLLLDKPYTLSISPPLGFSHKASTAWSAVDKYASVMPKP